MNATIENQAAAELCKRDYHYYNAGSLGVIGTIPAHQKGAYTYLPFHSDSVDGPWIRTEDLHQSRMEAENAAPARFSVANPATSH